MVRCDGFALSDVGVQPDDVKADVFALFEDQFVFGGGGGDTVVRCTDGRAAEATLVSVAPPVLEVICVECHGLDLGATDWKGGGVGGPLRTNVRIKIRLQEWMSSDGNEPSSTAFSHVALSVGIRPLLFIRVRILPTALNDIVPPSASTNANTSFTGANG
jgi:hypothetical protein